jgi:hypothetical protein
MPDGMPPLHPTKITIKQEGSPLAGATVSLVNAADPHYRWVVGGRTDANGLCQINTHGQYPGAPEGKYKVIVYKTITLESETRQQPIPSDTQAARAYYDKIATEEKSYDIVDIKYKKADTTDLEIEIKRGSNIQEFDVGRAVKQEFIPFGAR